MHPAPLLRFRRFHVHAGIIPTRMLRVCNKSVTHVQGFLDRVSGERIRACRRIYHQRGDYTSCGGIPSDAHIHVPGATPGGGIQ